MVERRTLLRTSMLAKTVIILVALTSMCTCTWPPTEIKGSDPGRLGVHLNSRRFTLFSYSVYVTTHSNSVWTLDYRRIFGKILLGSSHLHVSQVSSWCMRRQWQPVLDSTGMFPQMFNHCTLWRWCSIVISCHLLDHAISGTMYCPLLLRRFRWIKVNKVNRNNTALF